LSMSPNFRTCKHNIHFNIHLSFGRIWLERCIIFPSSLEVNWKHKNHIYFSSKILHSVRKTRTFLCVSFKHTNSFLYSHRHDSRLLILLPEVNLQPYVILWHYHRRRFVEYK
jgi:hypothetical protein